MAEKDLHRRLREWAYKTYGEYDHVKKTGLLKIIKLTTLAQYGEAGATDWMVIVARQPFGYVFFIELKNPDGSGECTDKQLYWQAQVRAMGFKVYVVDKDDQGKRIITDEVRRAQGQAVNGARKSRTYIPVQR